MLNRRVANFVELVWEAAARVGHSAPRVADDILYRAFPRTVEEAEIEGATKMLRNGVIAEAKRVLTQAEPDDGQIDFNEIAEDYRPIVQKLTKRSAYVPSREAYVSVKELIATPDFLDEARKYMRFKGEETIAQAAVLDQLYEAVMRKN